MTSTAASSASSAASGTSGAGASAATASAAAVEGSAYEIIKARLDEQGKALAQKSETLNARRLEVFGGTELAVLSNERIRTENNCVPRDILNVGGKLLFGFNVFIGLRKETHVHDVFQVHHAQKNADGTWNLDAIPVPGEDPATAFLRDERFVRDFTELYKYYKDASLLQLRALDSGKILAVFQTGPTLRDLRVLRWARDRAGNVRYVDNLGIDDHVFPPTHSFEWTRATRDDYVTGRHPHINVLDTVFIETVGGDLTIKVENNTATGKGIYTEPVEDKNQSLDDAQFLYAKCGSLILMKVLPYRETAWRHFVFNTRTKEAHRIDAIAASCVELPEDHGVIFPGGFALATGEVKTFDFDASGLVFKRSVRSPNGEDVLYVFYKPETGHRVLLSYNLIEKEVQSPIHCHGYSIFNDGTMLVFRAEGDEPTRVHPMRIWQTPYFSDEFAAQQKVGGAHADSLLVKVGNPEAVRAISDVQTLRRMIASQKPSVTLYEDLIAHATRTLDSYPWLRTAEVGDIAASITESRATAELVIDEFEKVQAIQKASAEALAKSEDEQRKIFGDIRPDSFTTIDPFVELMKRLRQQRGHLITLKEERYIDVKRLDALAEEAAKAFDELTRRAGEFLQTEGALKPYLDKHDEIVKATETVAQAGETKPLLEELERVQSGLKLLTEVTGQLKIDDANARTKILEDIASVIAQLNRARAVLEGRKKDLQKTEGTAEFSAQVKLFGQAVESALSMSDTPERCDQELARLLVQVEDLEGRFSEFEQFLEELAKKREETFEVLTQKKQGLLDARNRRAANLLAAAERILEGIKRRAMAMKSLDELNSAFAADPMVEKARSIAEELQALGDSVKADEVLSKLKSTRAEAQRQVRDKAELFVGGDDVVQLGKHQFTINTQAVDLTALPRARADGAPGLALHITGTSYYEDVEDAELLKFGDLFEEMLVSEDKTVARAEFLAASILFDAQANRNGLTLATLEEHRHHEGALAKAVSEVARARYDEGYDRGVHDADAAKILEALLHLLRQSGLLMHAPIPRALATVAWADLMDDAARTRAFSLARSAARVLKAFPDAPAAKKLIDDVVALLLGPLDQSGVRARLGATAADVRAAATYLVEEATAGSARFVLSMEAETLAKELDAHLETLGEKRAFEDDLASLQKQPAEKLALVQAWLEGLLSKGGARTQGLAPALAEAVAHVATRGRVERNTSGGLGMITVEGLLSQHARFEDGKVSVRLDELLPRLRRFVDERVPRFLAFKKRRTEVIDEARRRLKLNEIQPKVLSSFVRNKLVNDVYLPLVGDNLAKQMGAAGAKKRTDLMGLLLLVSPPGYGKTTLMEYVASRLGLVYVKANGPALGHDTTSLDPAEAPNATAKAEVEKINFAFEMGNNVLLLVDDIQHTHPELLQKFISLCDGTRRVEGVWKGKTRTYDLRGKKFVVCMAGNPYTESGEKFRIPDMLANRADTYNLGDILGGKEEAFALSYVENALTSSATLAPLATRDPADIYLFIRMAQGEQVPTTDFKHGYSGAEIDEIVRVLKKLLHVQKTLLKVNATYISSAATDERFRTEPSFKMQGSYRNMNKLAEKIVAVMNDDELERLVDDHYRSEAQTLTTGAEHNQLKLAELRGRQSPEQKARWEEIKKGFARTQIGGDASADPTTRVTTTIAALAQRMDAIGAAIDAASKAARPDDGAREVTTKAAALVAAELKALRTSVDKAQQSAAEQATEVAKGMAQTATQQAAQLAALVAQGAKDDDERKKPPPRPTAQKADPALLQKLDAAIEALSAAKIDVRLEAPAPAGIAELVRLQTILIEASLLPLVKGLAASIEHEKDNAHKLEAALEALKALDEKGLPAPQPVQLETYRPFKPQPKGTRSEDE